MGVFVPQIPFCFLKQTPFSCKTRPRVKLVGLSAWPRVGLGEEARFWGEKLLGEKGIQSKKKTNKTTSYFSSLGVAPEGTGTIRNRRTTRPLPPCAAFCFRPWVPRAAETVAYLYMQYIYVCVCVYVISLVEVLLLICFPLGTEDPAQQRREGSARFPQLVAPGFPRSGRKK